MAKIDSCSAKKNQQQQQQQQAGPRKGKAGLLKYQLKLMPRKDCAEGQRRFEIAKVPDPFSFDKGFFLFIRACQLLAQHNDGVVLVGLAGPSGAGKTVFSEKVLNFKPDIAVISMDNYNDASRLIDGNFDDPRLTDYDTLLQNIQDLKDGKTVQVPVYDFKSSSRVGYREVQVPSSRIVIIEGIYALSGKLRPLLDLRVSVTGGVHFDLVKRVLRDIRRSEQAPEDIIQQISETVYPMYKAYIEPDLETAHIKIQNKFNPFSGFQSPSYILKSSKIASEEQIMAVLSPDHKVATEEICDIYLLPPGEDAETCQSYLRMRDRAGRYSLMFEEWVVDTPFIISPRITFEVSAKLLGGLMTLGYEVTAVLKRTSKVFSDERITVKIDHLERFHRKYMQVQGKDRSLVKEVAGNLGLDGTYLPNSYIDQMQLEKLTDEVKILPDDLQSKLDKVSSSPLPSFSGIAEWNPGIKKHYSKSWSRNTTNDIDERMASEHNGSKQKIANSMIGCNGNDRRYEDKCFDSDQAFPDQACSLISDQIGTLGERIEELLCRVTEVENRLPSSPRQGQLPRQSSVAASLGNSLNGWHSIANQNGYVTSMPITTSNSSGNLVDMSLVAEVRNLSRGQKHLAKQLDVLGSLVRENVESYRAQQRNSRGIFEGFFSSIRTNDWGLAVTASLVSITVGSIAGMFAFRTSRT